MTTLQILLMTTAALPGQNDQSSNIHNRFASHSQSVSVTSLTPAFPYEERQGGGVSDLTLSPVMNGWTDRKPVYECEPFDSMSCGSCDCECHWRDESRWKHHYWHSAGGMFPHYPYQPSYHGYYYFRPYNYESVLAHRESGLPASRSNPYSTKFFKQIYETSLSEQDKKLDRLRVTVPFSGRTTQPLPDLQDLLKQRDPERKPNG